MTILENAFLNRKQQKAKQKILLNNTTNDNLIEIRILMVADHSMYDAFLQLHQNDEFTTYHCIIDYLYGIYDQVNKFLK